MSTFWVILPFLGKFFFNLLGFLKKKIPNPPLNFPIHIKKIQSPPSRKISGYASDSKTNKGQLRENRGQSSKKPFRWSAYNIFAPFIYKKIRKNVQIILVRWALREKENPCRGIKNHNFSSHKIYCAIYGWTIFFVSEKILAMENLWIMLYIFTFNGMRFIVFVMWQCCKCFPVFKGIEKFFVSFYSCTEFLWTAMSTCLVLFYWI